MLPDMEVSSLGFCCLVKEGILDLGVLQRPHLHYETTQDYG